jgi:hypothetical protein
MNRSAYYREYPKVLPTPNGPVNVNNIGEERAFTGTVPVAPDRAEAREPVGALPTAVAPDASPPLDAWQPGAPVITAQDRAEWRTWRRERVLKLQRERRRGMRRIDYYPRKRQRR